LSGKKELSTEEFIMALGGDQSKKVNPKKINFDLDRFVTLEEIQSKLKEHQFAVAYYVILEDALEHGDFVLYNSGPPPTYRIVRKGQPSMMSMKQ